MGLPIRALASTQGLLATNFQWRMLVTQLGPLLVWNDYKHAVADRSSRYHKLIDSSLSREGSEERVLSMNMSRFCHLDVVDHG